jgi:hypothetical protein
MDGAVPFDCPVGRRKGRARAAYGHRELARFMALKKIEFPNGWARTRNQTVRSFLLCCGRLMMTRNPNP